MRTTSNKANRSKKNYRVEGESAVLANEPGRYLLLRKAREREENYIGVRRLSTITPRIVYPIYHWQWFLLSGIV